MEEHLLNNATYIYQGSQSINEYITTHNEYAGYIKGGAIKGNHKIVAQNWKGYRFEDFFNKATDKPQRAIFRDWDIRVRDGACGVCSIMAARDWLLGYTSDPQFDEQRLTIEDMITGRYMTERACIKYTNYDTPETKSLRLGRYDLSKSIYRSYPNWGIDQRTWQTDLSEIYNKPEDADFMSRINALTEESAENLYWMPVEGELAYRKLYDWDKKGGFEQGGSFDPYFKMNQVKAMMILEHELCDYGRPVMMFFIGSTHEGGHFVLASSFDRAKRINERGGKYAIEDITVLDPCPTIKMGGGQQYYGVEIPFPTAQARNKDDASDGIYRLYRFYYKDSYTGQRPFDPM